MAASRRSDNNLLRPQQSVQRQHGLPGFAFELGVHQHFSQTMAVELLPGQGSTVALHMVPQSQRSTAAEQQEAAEAAFLLRLFQKTEQAAAGQPAIGCLYMFFHPRRWPGKEPLTLRQ